MDIRSAVPSQLIAESGSDIVVINFGSSNLRVGFATGQSPVVVPHCIAHHLSVPAGVFVGERKKGSIAELGVYPKPISATRKAERDEVSQMVESQMKMKPCPSPEPEGASPQVHSKNWASFHMSEDESFPWTKVTIGNSGSTIDAQVAQPSVATSSSSANDGHDSTPARRSMALSEVGTGPAHHKEEISEIQPEISEQPKPEIATEAEQEEIGKGLKEGTPIKAEEEEEEEEEEETPVKAEEEGPEAIVEDSEEETRKEPEQIAEDSEEELQKVPKEEGEDIIEDSEEEMQKVPKEEGEDTVEDSEEETDKEQPKNAIKEELDRQSPARADEPERLPEPPAVTEVHDGPDLEIHVEVRLEPEDETSSREHLIQYSSVAPAPQYRKYVCGGEALNIAVSQPYILRRPICRGHLNVTQQYSLQQVSDDLYAIWDWVLTEKLSMDGRAREQFSVVLVVPDTLDNREIKEVLSITLRDLRFRSAVVHQESVAATFGNGISTACVVNMGAQVTSIVCVEDGVAIPTTRVILPFGGEDISRCLLWVQQRWQTWPPIDTDPLEDPLDLKILDHIKEHFCLIIEGDQSAFAEVPYHEAGKPSLIYRGQLNALNVPIMGLFYPTLLSPDEYPSPLRPGFHVDHEDVLDDTVHGDNSRKPDLPDLGLPLIINGGGGPLVSGGTSEVAADESTGGGHGSSGPEESTLGLSRSIVNCILITTAGRPDLQKKLFASIQLVGGTAYTRGLVDAVEERVLHDIPAHEAVDTVAVLQNRTEAPVTCWKGGAVLGILDFARDAWVHHDDWVTGGVRLGFGRKYKDSYTLHSQAFYYSAIVE